MFKCQEIRPVLYPRFELCFFESSVHGSILIVFTQDRGASEEMPGMQSGSKSEFHVCSLLSFTETWLHSNILDNSIQAPNDVSTQADRDVTGSGQKEEEGLRYE